MKIKTRLFRMFSFSLLMLMLMPHLLFSQTAKPKEFRKFGVGIGYNANPVIVDTLRPIEISLRYRIDEKQTFQLYSPLAIKISNYPKYEKRTSKEYLVGLGLAYDYSFYSFSYFDLFAGVGIDYTRYKNMKDLYGKYNKGSEAKPYWVEESSYTLDKKQYGRIIPHIGLRLFFARFTAELKIALPLSYAENSSHSYWKYIDLASSNEGEIFPTNEIDYSIQRDASVNISYYF